MRIFLAKAAVCASVVWGTPVVAQTLNYSDATTINCVNAIADPAGRDQCVGASARACMEQTQGGYTTVAMSGCLDLEFRFWDRILNINYGVARDRARGMDAGSVGPVSVEAALRDMQRAWITFRDASCDFERSQWGGGTGGGPATVSCLMRMTGEQALYLDAVWIGQ